MRILTSILCALLAQSALSAELYRWKDKDGVTHYSDQPTPGAERMPMISAPPPGSVAAPAPPPRAATSGTAPFAYTSCEISSPLADQVFTNVDAISVSINLRPALQIDHRVNVQLNGSPVSGWPPGSTSYLLQNLFRGSYSLIATVTDAAGRTLCTSSSAISFHIRQPSMLTPGAKAAPRS